MCLKINESQPGWRLLHDLLCVRVIQALVGLYWGGGGDVRAESHHRRGEWSEAGLPLLWNVVALVENDPILRGKRWGGGVRATL